MNFKLRDILDDASIARLAKFETNKSRILENDEEKTTSFEMDGDTYYLTSIDSTHAFLTFNKDKQRSNPLHVQQMPTDALKKDVYRWLGGDNKAIKPSYKREGVNMKLKNAVIQAEDMTPEIGKKAKRDDLGKYGRKGWEKEIKVSGEKVKSEAKTKKETEDDLKRVDKDTDVGGPIRRWAEPTKLTAIVQEAEKLCKGKDDEDDSTMGIEPKIAEVVRKAEEDMTPEIGKKMKRDDLGKYGRKGWEKEIKMPGEKPKGESKLLNLITELESK